MRTMRTTGSARFVMSAICLLGLTCLLSCTTTGTDESKPEAVAREFFDALARKDFDGAAASVIPEDRADFRREAPNLPAVFFSNPDIEVTVKGKQGNKADAVIVGTDRDLGVAMELRQEQWWIVK